jgi:NTE family protein
VLAVACASKVPRNEPLEHWDPEGGYRLPPGYDAGRVLVVLALSGGGTRAASLAFGALEELRDTILPGGGRLLDEVDLIFGVSGGSVVAAYYALHGDAIFAPAFETGFLKHDVQGQLIRRVFLPRYWPRRGFDAYDRTDIVADYYDTKLFDGATFADLEQRVPPLVQITATDVSTGRSFPFTQEQFDLLCSDLDTFKVANAVAASTAVPGMFVPVTLRNYAGSCDYEVPEWVAEEIAQHDVDSRRFEAARLIDDYQDTERRAYVHLSDGGNSDNLGLRASVESSIGYGGLPEEIAGHGFVVPPRVLVVVVDAKIEPDRGMDRSANPPGAFTVVNTLMGVATNRYTLETLELTRSQLGAWVAELPVPGGSSGASLHVVHVNFNAIADAEERHFFNNVPTNFHLPAEMVDRLRALSRRQIRESRELQAMLAELRADQSGSSRKESAETGTPSISSTTR